jgi:hypothetical protein
MRRATFDCHPQQCDRMLDVVMELLEREAILGNTCAIDSATGW